MLSALRRRLREEIPDGSTRRAALAGVDVATLVDALKRGRRSDAVAIVAAALASARRTAARGPAAKVR